jgi:hypothetical protein
MAFRKRGGRKLVIAPDGGTWAPPHRRVDNAVVKAIARAFRWRKLLETGAFATVEEIAAAEKINERWTRRGAGGIVVRAITTTVKTVAKPPVAPTATDQEVRALLERYACPVPFHEVRTRFLGNIATPALGASPIKMVESLWGGELLEFPSIDAANELIGAVIGGLWNRLTRHQDRNAPFRLTRIETEATRVGLTALALMRRQELDGFIEGLFGPEKALDFPERAHRGLGSLAEMWALFEAAAEVAADETKPGTGHDMETTLRLLREMSKNAEHEIHAVVLSCTRAPSDARLAASKEANPTLSCCHHRWMTHQKHRIVIYGFSTSLPMTSRASSSSCARRTSASGRRRYTTGLTAPAAISASVSVSMRRRPAGSWS